jgi:hypothetical protein
LSTTQRPEDDNSSWPEDVIDEGFDDADEWYTYEEELPPEPPSLKRLLLTWGLIFAVLAVLGFGLLKAGERYHNPPSRIPPVPTASPTTGIYGPTRAISTAQQQLARVLESGNLRVEGETSRIAFPRTVADRLFGKRDEDALAFNVSTGRNNNVSILVLRESGRARVIAAGLPGAGDDISDLYVALPAGAAFDAVAALLPEAAAAKRRDYDESDYTIFGPFLQGNVAALKQRIEGNAVLRHQVQTIEAGSNDVSVAAPAFLIMRTPGGNRHIEALYQPSTNLVLEPLWGSGSIDSLAHELVHAMMDEVVPDETAAQRQAQSYLEANQPHLYTDIIGDLYQPLGRLDQAEEALAFLTGAAAAGQPTTIAPVSLLENQNLIERSAGLLRSDIEFLIGLDILPSCMEPGSLGYEKKTIDFAFYELVDSACGD